jgi:hypothetical protein
MLRLARLHLHIGILLPAGRACKPYAHATAAIRTKLSDSQACLVAVAQLSARWSSLAEEAFRSMCARAGWRLPRVPRGPSASTLRPWRTLFLSHRCHACHERGEWPVLNKPKQQIALLCLGCTASERVHNFMSLHLYTLQTVSVEGRDLPATREKKKRRRAQHP